ncbi:homeobox domain protein [Rhizoctonia solani AG-3 Rhs1AP]|uniref:Homeobox domain protein n=2 Tax=Rhizoctonia solani AG-3 TaxID=1086053 RepID=A0A074SSD0_9AGAM|nr:homeobox domain protein [Rhizoctonia solani AG-3 Rhs1AP]KEP52877.1 homeobox domain protein [Rhizoctonia solani 123E]
MDNSLFRSVLQTVQKHAALTPDHFASAPNDRLLFDHRLAYTPLSTSLPELDSQLLPLSFPPHLNSELRALLTNDLNEDNAFIEQTRQRLLHQLSTLSTSLDPTAVPSLVRAAFDAFHHRSINARIEALRRELSEFGPPEGSVSESEGASDSELDFDESDDDQEDEEPQVLGDEDDNAPIRPGEDVPPLETKYLPIFEALHERGKVLTKPEKTYLVNMTGMTYRQITIWFQNRRRGELKEHTQRVPLSHAVSVDSCASSDASGDECELEQKLAVPRTDATFDIRSWRLTSALPIKAGSFPASPTKNSFDPAVHSGSDSGDTDLSDESEGNNAPPGLHAPSLSTSITTIDSTTTANASLREVSGMVTESTINQGDNYIGSKSTSRVTKPLPVRCNPTPMQTTPIQPAFTFNFGDPGLESTQPPSGLASVSPPHLVTSDMRGLTVQMNTTPPSSTTTLQLSTHAAPTNGMAVPALVSSNGSSPRRSTSIGSPQRNPSPTPSGHSTSSPRLPVKPLPRRTGCAPRPRPPPRVSPPSTAASATASNSARASVVLPPSSNPSLSNTTLGSLLRPNQPAPNIPQGMEERLVAMAGRMGVGMSGNSSSIYSNTRQTAITAPPGRTLPSFSSGSLPRLNMPSGTTLPPLSGHPSQNSAEPRS